MPVTPTVHYAGFPPCLTFHLVNVRTAPMENPPGEHDEDEAGVACLVLLVDVDLAGDPLAAQQGPHALPLLHPRGLKTARAATAS